MSYYFDLPQSFMPLEFLRTPRLAMRADDARWLVSTIVRKMAMGDVDQWGLVRLHSDILRRVMNQRTCEDVISSLLDGAIERGPYRVGERAFGYRLAKRYLGDDLTCVCLTDPRLNARIDRERLRIENCQKSRWRPIHQQLAAVQEGVTIRPEANELVDGLQREARLCQRVLVNDIQARRLRFVVGNTGRVFNAVCGLKRELRRTLRLNGEALGGIDIRASQPSLLGMMLYKQYLPSNELNDALTYSTLPPGLPVAAGARGCFRGRLPVDVRRFVDDARNGRLYERLGSSVGVPREFAKHRVLVDVLAKHGSYPSAIEDEFRRAFPTVYAIVREINGGDHCTLIRWLQSVEAWLVIDMVCARLIRDEIPVVTIHDSVFTQMGLIERVEAAFEEVFDDIGFRLSLKREIPGNLEARSDPSAALQGMS